MIIDKEGYTTKVCAEFEIKLSTYKEERLAFFKVLQDRQRKKLEHIEKSKGSEISFITERFIKLSEEGMILSFYNDVVEMLESEFRAPTEKGGAKE